jgi:ankyrin repeat protein
MKSKKSKIRKNEFLWRITSAIDRDNTEALCEIISELALKTDAERLLGKALTESSKALKINGTKYLLDQNAPVEGSPDSPSPLLLALRDQDPNGWPDSWVQKNKKSSALVEQNSRCRTAIIEMLLDHGANTEAVDEEGRTPLLITSFAGSDEVDRVAIVDMLLQHGANTEAVDKEGKTPLILALHQKHQGIVDILIDHGANVNAKDHLQRNSLNIIAADDESSSRDWSSTINSLLQRKVCTSGPEAQDEWGRTPLHWACASGNLPLAKQLLSVSMIEDKDISSNTALHLAASLRTSELVALLISHHADVNARSEGGWTPLHRASDVGHVKTVQVLLNAGADVNAVLLNKKSSLHLSAQNGHLKVVQLLLSRHDLTKWPTKDAFNKTAFMRAAQKKHQDVVHILDPTRLLLSVSDDVIGACKGFGATVMDFGDYRNGIRSREMTVFSMFIPKHC